MHLIKIYLTCRIQGRCDRVCSQVFNNNTYEKTEDYGIFRGSDASRTENYYDCLFQQKSFSSSYKICMMIPLSKELTSNSTPK